MENYNESKGTDRIDRFEQAAFSFIRYFFPAIMPMLLYIGVEIICILFGALIVNMGMPLEEFIKRKINIYTSLGVLITFTILRKKSKKSGSGFFEDASLYINDISIKKSVLGLIFGISAAFAISAFLSLLPSIGPVAAYEESVSRVYARWSVLLGMLFTTFFTPLVEEVIFRGYMLNRVLPHWGEKRSLFVVSFIFALMHGTSIWILYAFFMGWAIGKVSIDEDNIFYSVMMHVGFNLPAAVLWFIYLTVPGSKEYLENNLFLVFLIGMLALAAACYSYVIYKKMKNSIQLS